MTTFALVHGAWHGGWCWERVVAELEAGGHTAVAPDLPCEDPEAGASRYAEVVCQALEGAGGEDMVVVGHSLGGLTIPVVAARRPVRRLVFLAAFIPQVGWSLVESTAVVCDDDHLFSPDWIRRQVRLRLGVEPVQFPGGHMPFLARPSELAAVLAGL